MTGLPAGWQLRCLSEIAHITLGQSPPSASYNTAGLGLPFFQGKAEFGDLYPDVRKYTTAGTKFAEPGDILLSVRAPVGPTNLAPTRCAIGRGLAAVRAGDAVDARYLLWALRALEDRLAAMGAGSTFAAVTAKQVRELQVPLAPRAEQTRIVEILEDHLSRLDAANDYLDAVARRLRSLEVAVLHETVESTAERVHLRDLVARVEAGRSFGGAAPPAQPDEWGVIKVSAMTWGEFQPGENKAVPAERVDARFEIAPGDLLVSRANTSAYVGASVLVRETRPKLLLSDKSLRLVPQPGVDTEWLHLALSAPGSRAQISSHATGTKDSMRNISQASLLSIEVPQASFDEQRAQVSRVRAAQSAIRALALAATEANARAERLRRGLLSAAFSGRLAGRSSDLDLAEEMTFA